MLNTNTRQKEKKHQTQKSDNFFLLYYKTREKVSGHIATHLKWKHSSKVAQNVTF